jgi:NADH-quinone oxidoreductase subunit A
LLTNYGYIGLFLIVTIGFCFLMIIIPIVLRFVKVVPHNPNPLKNLTFECGMETIGKSWVRFNFRYYFYALVFLALDILIVFLYPWAVDLKGLGQAGLITVIVMIFIVVIGYLYAWRKKVLEWK